MKCFYCDSEVIWGSDFTYEEYGVDGEGVVSTFVCQNCGAEYDVYMAEEALNEYHKRADRAVEQSEQRVDAESLQSRVQ